MGKGIKEKPPSIGGSQPEVSDVNFLRILYLHLHMRPRELIESTCEKLEPEAVDRVNSLI